jgi:hypothetical protein
MTRMVYSFILCFSALMLTSCGDSVSPVNTTTPAIQNPVYATADAITNSPSMRATFTAVSAEVEREMQRLKPPPMINLSGDNTVKKISNDATFDDISETYRGLALGGGDYRVSWSVEAGKYGCMFNANLHPEEGNNVRDTSKREVGTDFDRIFDNRTRSALWIQVPIGSYYLVVQTNCKWQITIEPAW